MKRLKVIRSKRSKIQDVCVSNKKLSSWVSPKNTFFSLLLIALGGLALPSVAENLSDRIEKKDYSFFSSGETEIKDKYLMYNASGTSTIALWDIKNDEYLTQNSDKQKLLNDKKAVDCQKDEDGLANVILKKNQQDKAID